MAQSYGVLCFGMALNGIVPKYYAELETKKEDMEKIVSYSVWYAIGSYYIMGVVGSSTFLPSTKLTTVFMGSNIPITSDILDCINQGSSFSYLSSLALSIMLVMVTPAIVFECSLSIMRCVSSSFCCSCMYCCIDGCV